MTPIKIAVVGESCVGKTSVIHRFKSNIFIAPCLTFQDFHVIKTEINHMEVQLEVWETCGLEVLRYLAIRHCRSAQGVLLVYNVKRTETFQALSRWLNEIRSVNKEAEVIIVGNKNEDPSRREVTMPMVDDFANKENLEYIETSAKTGENVEWVFRHLVEKILISKRIPLSTSRREEKKWSIRDFWRSFKERERERDEHRTEKRTPSLPEVPLEASDVHAEDIKVDGNKVENDGRTAATFNEEEGSEFMDVKELETEQDSLFTDGKCSLPQGSLEASDVQVEGNELGGNLVKNDCGTSVSGNAVNDGAESGIMCAEEVETEQGTYFPDGEKGVAEFGIMCAKELETEQDTYFSDGEKEQVSDDVDEDFIAIPMFDMMNKGQYIDVDFAVSRSEKSEAITFSAHKLVLSLWSPYFADMFKESDEEMENSITFKDVDPKAFGEMLRFMYGCRPSMETCQEAFEIYNVSEKFHVNHLSDICCNKVKEIRPGVYNVFEVLEASIFMNIEFLKKHCLELIQQKTAEVFASSDVAQVSVSIVHEILESRTFSLTSEKDLLEWIFKWAKHLCYSNPNEYSSIRKVLSEFLPRLHFASLTSQEFAQFFLDHKTFFDMDEAFSILMNIAMRHSRPLPEWLDRMCDFRVYTGGKAKPYQ